MPITDAVSRYYPDAPEPEPRSLWSWRYHTEAAMRRALEEYTAAVSVATTRYGEQEGDEPNGKTEMVEYRKRAEIDRCMDALEYPFFWRILDLYYRRGLSCEHYGWATVAKRIGLRGDPRSRWDRDTFERQVAMAISRLWRVHEDRYRRTRLTGELQGKD